MPHRTLYGCFFTLSVGCTLGGAAWILGQELTEERHLIALSERGSPVPVIPVMLPDLDREYVAEEGDIGILFTWCPRRGGDECSNMIDTLGSVSLEIYLKREIWTIRYDVLDGRINHLIELGEIVSVEAGMQVKVLEVKAVPNHTFLVFAKVKILEGNHIGRDLWVMRHCVRRESDCQ